MMNVFLLRVQKVNYYVGIARMARSEDNNLKFAC